VEIAPPRLFSIVDVKALKLMVIKPVDASHVRPSMNNPATSAAIFRSMVATFFTPYPNRNPKVPPKPIWVASRVAHPELSKAHTQHHAFRCEALKIRQDKQHKVGGSVLELNTPVDK
jgi:hypothetical protein